MNKWLLRIAIGIALVAGLYVLVGGIGTSVALNYLLTPGNVDWSGSKVVRKPVDPMNLGYHGDPRTALNLPFETITYPTELGAAEAWFVPAAKMDGPWAIYVHGIGGIRENGYRQLSILHEAGIPTLMITYRNDIGAPVDHGVFSFGVNEWHDLDAAVTWALGQGARGILLVADSMGGAIVGQFLMHSEQADKVAALALDAPALDLREVVADKLGGRLLPFAKPLAEAGIGFFDLYRGADLIDAVSFDAVAEFPGPLFLAHGAADTLVPVGISDRLAAARTAPTVYLRTNAEHLRSYKENPARYREELRGWLEGLATAAPPLP